MWNDNDRILSIFRNVEDGKSVYPCECPVCNTRNAHIYIHKHNDRHCGMWAWCSNCGAFSHTSGTAPKWWKNPDFVDSSRLCGEPQYLDQMKESLDDWINAIIPKEVTKSSKPFIMENRFEVILEEDLQGIPAGTSGTIIVKDDFKTMTIDFIAVGGKRIRIHEEPDSLLKKVKVINPSDNNQSPSN